MNRDALTVRIWRCVQAFGGEAGTVRHGCARVACGGAEGSVGWDGGVGEAEGEEELVSGVVSVRVEICAGIWLGQGDRP